MAFQITKGKIPGAQKIVIYGPEGIGKTTFASKFPEPLFIDTEGSTKHIDVSRFPAPSSWQMLLSEVDEVINDPGLCKTLVIDTADWAEVMCIRHVCESKHVAGIEDINYGKGYVYVKEEFGRLLNKLSDLTAKGVNVVVTAHAMMRKFEQPDEMGAYDRWELKLNKQTAPLLKEWPDALLFANYRTHVVEVNGTKKAQGGKRVMYASHNPSWDAKNRFGLPDMMDFSYDPLRKVIEGTDAPAPTPVPMPAPTPAPAPKPKTEKKAEKKAEPAKPAVQLAERDYYWVTTDGKDYFYKTSKGQPMPSKDSLAISREITEREFTAKKLLKADKPKEEPKTAPKAAPKEEAPAEDLTGIDQRIVDLMKGSGLHVWDVENVCVSRGKAAFGQKLADYPAGLVNWIIRFWDNIVKLAAEIEIPFN
jgi:GTPase SAR1 family protein